MDNARNILDALSALDPCRCDYQQWTDVGMALKAEGFPCSVWDNWSSRDAARYHPGECEKKWDTFNGSGVTGGTIVHLAQTLCGFKISDTLDWDDGLDAYYDEVMAITKKEEEPYQMAIRYLETLFLPDESVSFVHSAQFKEDKQKWIPADAGHVFKASTLINKLKKRKNLEDVFGTINPEAGAWIRINPTDGAGNKDVTRYAYSLVESDKLEVEDQKKLLVNFRLPIAAMVESGGKSVHAIVKIDAENEAEYKQRVAFLFDWLAKHQFIVDENNKNPARLSRLPGAERNGRIQRLVATEIGCGSWNEWQDYIEGFDDDLPPMETLWDQAQDPPELSQELISGVLREGCKMIITGESKAGKTCLSQNLAVCIAEGKPWLGKFQCQQGKVLYINLEVEKASLYKRFEAMYKAMGIKMTKEGGSNIVPWNLRGYAVPLDKLASKIIRRCRNENYKAIILDPLYKVQQGDENSAEAIIKFCNALDKIAHETGAAVIYDHHHPKGSAGERKVIDRGSGSGVFARDADAICDLSFLSPTREALELLGSQMKDGEKPMQLAFVLRDFKDIEPINIWFRFPLHFIDSTGLLDGAPVEGSREDNLNQSSKRTTENERKSILDKAFQMCQSDGIALLDDMEDWCGKSPTKKTLRNYIKEFADEYECKNSRVWKKGK